MRSVRPDPAGVSGLVLAAGGAREMKLAMLALLVHPFLILGPSGLYAATNWELKAENNPAAHGLSEISHRSAASTRQDLIDFLDTL